MSKIKKKNIRKEYGFVSKTLLTLIIVILLFDAIVLENMMINKVKGITPLIMDSVTSLSEEKEESKNLKEAEGDITKNEEYDKEDIRYTKNCEEIVKDMGMGDGLIRENDKEMNIRYHQTRGNDLIITIRKDGSCTIKEEEK